MATPPDWGGAVAVAFIGVAFLGWWEYSIRPRRASKELLEWLALHADEILAGGADYKGIRVTATTEIVTYWVAISYLIISTLRPSGTHLASDPKLAMHQAISTMGSILFGCWGIPWGPIYTARALDRNAKPERELVAALLERGGHRVQVA